MRSITIWRSTPDRRPYDNREFPSKSSIEDAVKDAYGMRASDMYGYIVVPVEDSNGNVSWASFLTSNGEISLIGDLCGSIGDAERVAKQECRFLNTQGNGCFREGLEGCDMNDPDIDHLLDESSI